MYKVPNENRDTAVPKAAGPNLISVHGRAVIMHINIGSHELPSSPPRHNVFSMTFQSLLYKFPHPSLPAKPLFSDYQLPCKGICYVYYCILCGESTEEISSANASRLPFQTSFATSIKRRSARAVVMKVANRHLKRMIQKHV